MEKENERDGEKGKMKITNPDKILFPKTKISKEQLVEYYENIAECMLPHIKGRPITMNRFPDGVQGETFYQKNAPDYFPDYIPFQPVEKSDGGIVNYAIINNKKALSYIANYVCVPHIWLSREPKLNYPDRMIFDLDPSEGVSFTAVKWAAKELRKLLDQLELPSFLMTTGSRGLHVVIPLKRRYLFDEVRELAQDIARSLVEKHPAKLTLAMKKSERGKKIFVDTLRNAWSATSVAPYAVRAKEGAPIATPLKWSELAAVSSAQKYTVKNIFQRISKSGDLWKDIDKHGTALAAARKKLARLMS